MSEIKFIKSKEVKDLLKIRSCDLMHLRESGVLRAEKKGNAFLYIYNDVEKFQKENKSV